MEDELTFCVGDGCVNCFADDGGWEGYCPECLALWDDHAAGQHDFAGGCLSVVPLKSVPA